jgi:hypothetical protein
MKDVYILKNGMTKEQMFRLRLMNGFNFAPITADAILELCNDFFRNNKSNIRDGQILYLAISEEEGPEKTILDASGTKRVCLEISWIMPPLPGGWMSDFL